MATFLNERFGDREIVSESPTRLTGYSISSTGVDHRFVTLIDGDQRKKVVVVPPGETVSISGLNEPYTSLDVESEVGDGQLVVNIDHEPRMLGEVEETSN